MRTILSIFILLSSFDMYACDICGCAMGGNYFGILPNYQKYFLGVRYKYSKYQSLHPDDGELSQDYFHTTEIWARYVPHKNIQIYALLPFQFTQRVEGIQDTKINGLGDASIISNFTIFNNGDNLNKQWKHFAQIGGGIKFPTGKSNIIRDNSTLPSALQLGSGTFDYVLNSIYTVRYKKIGFNLDANYRINTQNTDTKYKNGKRIAASSRFFYWMHNSALSIVPHVGIDYEGNAPDTQYNKTVDYTGGKSLLANAGVDVFYQNYSLGVHLQAPIYQRLNNGQTTSSTRIATQFNYYF